MKRKFTFLTAALALLAFLAIPTGMWGQSTKTEGFETKASATNYQGTVTISANESDCGIGWVIYYGNVSTTGPISGTKSAQMRWYKNASANYPYLKSTTAIDGLTNVAFTAKVGHTDLQMDVHYSSDGENWTALATAVTFADTDPADFSYEIPSGGKYIMIGVSSSSTVPNGSYYSLLVDDVVFTYSGTVNTYTVTYHANVAGTTDIEVVYSGGDDVTVAANTFTNPGYAFTEWNTEANGNGDSYAPNDVIEDIDDDIDLYAQWEESNEMTLVFPLTSNPNSWPTSTVTSLTEYTYPLNGVDYTFALKNVKYSNGYLMVYYVGAVGLPAIEGYKLTKVVASNSSGCSTAVNVGISSSASSADYIDGGEIQVWSTQNSQYTYNLTSTEENTMYYLYVTNKNAQVTSLALTYEPATAPSVATPVFTPESGTEFGNEGLSVTISCETTGASIYYTLDGSTPDNSSTLYNGAINLTATTTIKAIAYDGTNYSNEATATYTYVDPDAVDNISDITEAGTYAVRGTIVAMSQRGFIVGDGTGYIYYYNQNYTQADYNIGDIVRLNGPVVVYGGVYEFNNTTTVTAATSSNYVAEDPTVLSGADMDARVASTTPAQLSIYVQYEGRLTANGSYYNITSIEGAATAKGSISYPLNTDFASLDGKQVKVTGYYVGISSGQYYNTMIGSIEEVISSEPYIAVTPDEVNATAEGGNGILPVVYENINEIVANVFFCDATGTTAATYDWIYAEMNDDDNVEYSIDANDGAARTAYFMVNVGDTYSNLVTINQAAFVPTPVGGDYVRISSLNQLTDGSIVVIAARYDEVATAYYAMTNATTGKPAGVAFTSETSNEGEILPDTIVNEIGNYFWIVNVTSDGYTFTNANGQVMGYTSSTNFATGGDNTEWTIEYRTSDSIGGMVQNYDGFVITNVNNSVRAFALNGNHNFGPYHTQNMTAENYNFFLDFFVQTEATQTLTQTAQLVAGTNWFSTYVDITLEDLQTALTNVLGTGSNVSITIQSQTQSCSLKRGRWTGTLDALDLAYMYKISVSADCEITLVGMPVNPAEHPVTIVNGDNWIAYPFSESMTLIDAFAGLAVNNDIVTGQIGSSKYTRGSWRGGLTVLEPGQGYIYTSVATNDKIFTFPTVAK